MILNSFLLRIEKRHLISRSPHPAIPFAIALAFFLLAQAPSPLSQTSLALAIVSLLFAILHFIVVMLLKNNRFI